MKRLSIRKKKEARWAYLFISPFIIGFLIFMLGPMLFSVIGSFTDYNLTSKMNFIGLANFKRMFVHDDLFWKSLYNTVYFVIFNVPLTTIFSVFFSHSTQSKNQRNQCIPYSFLFTGSLIRSSSLHLMDAAAFSICRIDQHISGLVPYPWTSLVV